MRRRSSGYDGKTWIASVTFGPVHTNDAPGALTRLLDLGVPAYLIASTVEAVLAQRLVRVLCSDCRKASPPPVEWLEGFLEGFKVSARDLPVVHLPGGCELCRGTGYRGRVGIYELLVMDDEVRAALLAEGSVGDLRRIAEARGLRRLLADGLRQVRLGVTSPEEVLRVCGG